ncbi:MAG: GAF domain-containing protein [Betaproteobacteria bacterium]
MPRGATPVTRKAETRAPVARKPRKTASSKAGDLEKRLATSVEQQAATSEILRVISASPADIQPVVDVVAERAARLCNAPFARVLLVDGNRLRVAAEHSVDGSAHDRTSGVPLSRTSVTGRAVLDVEVVHHADILPLLDTEFPDARENARRIKFRAVLAVPLTRETGAYGAIFLWRREPGLFAPDQVELVQTFARQVSIAVDNVRLFNETKEALEQQTSTSEILRAISTSPTEVLPVFETIARCAAHLCGAEFCQVYQYDGELLHFIAYHGLAPAGVEAARRAYPMAPGRGSAAARSILNCSIEQIPDVDADRDYAHRAFAKIMTFRSIVAVPMLRDGLPIGSIAVARMAVGYLPERQVALLKTFADQAVIAIENVRLFTELGARNRDLAEALEQQTATSEILRAISDSPTEIQPVLEAVVHAAARFCAAPDVLLLRLEGGILRGAASVGRYGEVVAERIGSVAALEIPLTRGSVSGRAVLDRRSIHIHDLATEDEKEYPMGRELQRQFGNRTVLATPLLREGAPIGVIALSRMEVRPFPKNQVELLKTFADQAVIAIENVRLFTELEARNRDITEALEQQTATSEILRVISQSPRDVQPVFDTIAEAALKLCGASVANVVTLDAGMLHLRAHANLSLEGAEALERSWPQPLGGGTAAGRAVQSAKVVVIPDVLEDRTYAIGASATTTGFRSVASVPLVRDGIPIGAINVGRHDPGPFPDKQIALLRTFADQAVIAIENVRLFTELAARNRDITEALEQQTATSEILRVISQSPTDVHPVFETLAENAVRLCDADKAFIHRFDGEVLRMAAAYNASPELREFQERNPHPPGRQSCAGRIALEHRTVQIPDAQADPEYAYALQVEPVRTVLGVPLLKGHNLLGTINIYRLEVKPFTDRQIALMETFADQAVIAIENVRLFTELEARNRDITEALEQQTATSEILRVISSSPTDVQPVFDIIGESAERLCDAELSMVSRLDGDLIQLVAAHGVTPGGTDLVRAQFPMRLSAETVTARTIRSRAVVQVTDVLADPQYEAKEAAVAGGFRGSLGVPMFREGQVIGCIFVARRNPGHFTDSQVELLKTFADQAVIAIENVRLFTELDARNRDITEALEQQTATSEILRVISKSPTDVQPVFDTIAGAVLKLCSAEISVISRVEGELIHLVALRGVTPEGMAAIGRHFPMRMSAETVTARTVRNCATVHVPDAWAEQGYESMDAARAGNYRSCLGVPMLRDGRVIGAIFVGRHAPGHFAASQIMLLQTFADQAVIAIENVRLFTELQARTTELTQSVGELKALGEVGQAVSSTLDLETVLRTIVSRATHLSGMDGGAIYEYDENSEQFYLRTANNYPDALVEVLRSMPVRKGEGAVGTLAVTFDPVEIRDIADDPNYQSRVREILIRLGYRSLLAVPLLREDKLLGGLVVNRKRSGEFAPKVIDLLKTFASQSALAIQNARLFREIEDKSRQLEVASQHKSEFLANMSHELRTPLNAIIGFSEVLYERMFGEINDKQAEYLADILESGRHLLSLINDILDLSKIEAGRMELDLAEFNLPNAIENTLTLVRERAHRRGIALEREIDAHAGAIRADERKVKQVLLNLLSNALKFTPEGGRIDVRAVVHDGVTEISVTDTGVGIAPDDQATVFEEFRQVGASAKKVEGTGLGLAISRKFIELHGGRIWVTSEVGVGSTFAFALPSAGPPLRSAD